MLTLDDVLSPDWPAPAGIRAIFTTRAAGVSTAPYALLNLGLHVGDDVNAVKENRHKLRALLPAEPAWLNQVHGVAVAELAARARGERAPIADAAVTSLAKLPCTVLVADCLPILFCDRAGSRVGAAHAGWRGLAAGVIERTVEAMHTPPAELMAWLGPAIGPSTFEVGAEVLEAFVATSPSSRAAFRSMPGKTGKYLADLYLLARQRLAQSGVTAVHGGAFCTYSDPLRFFSYRRDGQTGRMAAVIWRE